MDPKKQRIKGTGTFKVVRFNDIPFEKQKDISHTRVVCEYRTDKDDLTGHVSKLQEVTY